MIDIMKDWKLLMALRKKTRYAEIPDDLNPILA